MTPSPEELLRSLFDAAVAAADPMRCLPAALPPRPVGRRLVVGAGKAAARMAEAVEQVWGPCEGLVITRDGYERRCAGIEIASAAHPVPDARGRAATRRMLDLLGGLGEADEVLALVSGGASALMVAPAGRVTLEEKRAINAALLASGAPIEAMNTVRKHLSAVKGGRLAAAAWPARMTALVISDVAGDDLAAIASGPTVGDRSTPAEARAILDRHGIAVPASVAELLDGPSGVISPDDARLSRCETRLVAAPSQSLAAAAAAGRRAGCRVEILGDAIEGEAREVAAEQARLARARQAELRPGDAPLLLLSGGECTVTRRGEGSGGPNAEYALALALALREQPGIDAIACDTDGVDGAAEVAGAIVGPRTLARARAAGRSPEAALATNDAHGFFAAVGGQVVTGPTLTNVNDFRAILVRA
ncbi:glycerate kinase type-2 family protein [Limimaricola pyoseonensis]|uniref:Glycerate 2-kinase n=1 Tax=Limimaricola pyoseonensis TaxID=521013 RepID=A0A1G7HM96_9RHOB|nr:glycerate kinase [Limimaricola pyoseonensis]SDF01600.1 glycerate 2-kinase [Limimaricola pyoseonensis]